ncbi:hypothetical protein CLAFUW4_09469 [Fulvia fulva]|uniref:Uncharacterized protein n=1 Tax=Passalora fulva TaxID=5499 RepID=A0A9Q8PF35_PASFU|nr:uncharacterized protein CLAFUR5_09566 [Fulvia fulva]KAK4613493.1 hypothetical protein CLAFUR4_09475 [Fulvia fulva]KAK4615074.1 hypothetical protein CLAFUR0_09466 [Fulvia fulva]UJO21434.1 hypothetical protein CLAFUR5_09566 [Fulvia fulva]WPV20536.1 hypothetical protein CLAFUW4_09469 [Fulvia fulva]WPV35130.1 hypothetical protein CLAFUW7_09470 [Fulvia fulva]
MAATASSPTGLTLEQRVKALPQELQDLIYGFTFEQPDPTTITIDANFRPPVNLQINKAIRKSFAALYYSKFIFCSDDIHSLQNWVVSLTSQHRAFLWDLRLHGYQDGVCDGDRSVATARATKFWQSLPSEARKEIRYFMVMASYVLSNGAFREANVAWATAEPPMEIPERWEKALERARRKLKWDCGAAWMDDFWQSIEGVKVV